jgi:hypothetical protein
LKRTDTPVAFELRDFRVKETSSTNHLNTGGFYMFRHSTNTASFFSVLIAALIFSLSLAGVAAAQGNTSLGTGALQNNTTRSFNTATGVNTLLPAIRSAWETVLSR